ncbi:MAG: hypothetical protein KGI08_00255 [Thaumarchaeota archaeon]|nr:hypothetical protein [Nitrososphaerota archaeon]
MSKLPSVSELTELVKDKIITQEEAKEVLFAKEDTDVREEESFKEEIRFLRGVIEKLSQGNRTTIVEIIREVEKPYHKWEWFRPYEVYCNGSINANGGGLVMNYASTASLANSSFSSINTF